MSFGITVQARPTGLADIPCLEDLKIIGITNMLTGLIGGLLIGCLA